MADYSGLTIEPGGMARFTRADHFNLGDSGDAARELNLFLIEMGYLDATEIAKNGGEDIAGTGTMNAIQYWRRDLGLPDGGRNVTADDLRAARTIIKDSGVADNAEAYTGNAGGYALTTDFGTAGVAPTVDPDATVVTTEVGTVDETSNEATVGQANSGILTSKEMAWFFDPETGKWMVAYGLPNSERSVFFEASGVQMDAIFGDGQRPTDYETLSFKDLSQQEGVTFGGDVAEVQGTGSFEAEFNSVIARGLDEGTLPEWAKTDGALLDILFIAESENKSTDWVIEQISTLPSFAQRFPGIATLKSTGLTTTEAVTGFLELESGVKSLVLADGGNPDTVTPDMVGGLVAKGHSLTDVQFTYGIFDRMEKNAGSMAAFNDILSARGVAPLDADGMFDFMAGQAPKELYDIWEESSLHNAAMKAGLNIGTEGAIDLARRTEGLTSYDSAMEGLNLAAQNILRFRTQLDLNQYGLEEQDLIDLSLGLAPSSGKTQADIGQSMDRVIRSAQAQTEKARVNPFNKFTGEGVPQSASLSRSASERA